MKIAVIPVVVALAFASCTKETVVKNEEPATPAPVRTTPAPATPVPKVAVTAPPAATPTPAPQLAPEGVFYLIAAARMETPDGVHGLPPGTGVKLIRPGVYLTPYGETALAQETLTNDLAMARSARDAYAAAQTAAQQRGAADASAAAVKARAAATENGASHEAALKGLERERLEKKIAELRRQQIVVNEQIRLLDTKQSKENYNRLYKNRVVTSTTDQQIAVARVQWQTLEEQIGSAQQELRNIR